MKILTTAAFASALMLFGCSAETQYEAAVEDVQDAEQDVMDERVEMRNEVGGEIEEGREEIAGEIKEGREEIMDEQEDLAEEREDLREERNDLAEERLEERTAAKVNPTVEEID